jgi:hypothetical protein
MRRFGIKATAGAGLVGLVLATAGMGQQATVSKPPPAKTDAGKPVAKSKLEELLGQALQNNADIRVATAKLNEAEAELHRARLQVMQKVVQSYQAVEAARATVDFRQKEYERVKQLGENAAVPAALVDEREKSLAAAKGQLAAAEADLSFLLGKAPAESRTFRYSLGLNVEASNQADLRDLRTYYGLLWLAQAQRAANKPGPVADRLRKALDRPVTITAEEQPLSQVLKLIRDANPELHVQLPRGLNLEGKVTVKLENVPLGAAMQWLEDVLPGFQVVVRDYGLLLAEKGSLPPRALLLDDFWKGGDRPKGAETGARAGRESVEGLVKAVDEKSGLLTITIGSDAGLAKGDTLEVFRIVPTPGKPKYLGKVSVIEVTASEAVAKPQGRLAVPPMAGDRVADRILGN